jgi:hypothetical protein
VSEYGVGAPGLQSTTSDWVHYTCDCCKAQVRMQRLEARRPKTWATVTLNTSIGNTVTIVCGRCFSESKLLQTLLATAYDDG